MMRGVQRAGRLLSRVSRTSFPRNNTIITKASVRQHPKFEGGHLIRKEVYGIHHVTAIAGDPQANVDFYAGSLGLRMVKKTVNFDNPGTYHFYYGDEYGNPETILPFFPSTGRVPKGRAGNGQLTIISFSIPENAISYWTERLKKLDIDFTGPYTCFDEEVIGFHDRDGIELELVGSAADSRKGWENGVISPEHAIRGCSTYCSPKKTTTEPPI